jgi:acetyltransferase-like isoleucine patch superfamily enzyme
VVLMNNLWNRLLAKLTLVRFRLSYGAAFKSIGNRSFAFGPCRIDGASGIELGPQSVFQRGVWLYCSGTDSSPASLKIGKGCVFGYNNHITSVREVLVGDYVLTANNVYISDNLHGFENISVPIMHQPVQFKKAVSIGDGCWLGENVCVIGARIGKNCAIGANAVVVDDIPDYSVAVGVPARVIRQFDQTAQKWISTRRSLTE